MRLLHKRNNALVFSKASLALHYGGGGGGGGGGHVIPL